MKTIEITYSDGTRVNLVVAVPCDAKITHIDGKSVEVTEFKGTPKYRIKTPVGHQRLDNWSPCGAMDKFYGHPVTQEEYDRVVAERGAILSWSGHWYIHPHHIEEYVEVPKPAVVPEPIKKYRIKQDLKSGSEDGWNNDMDPLKGRILTDAEYQKVIDYDGVKLPWSRGWYILPKHLEAVPTATKVKKYRVKLMPELDSTRGVVYDMYKHAGRELTKVEWDRIHTEGSSEDRCTKMPWDEGNWNWRPDNVEEYEVEVPKATKYYVKTLDELQAIGYPNWCSPEMDKFAGRELTKEEYDKAMASGIHRGAHFPWSGTWQIEPRHVKAVEVDITPEPTPEPKKWRVKTKEELLADGWEDHGALYNRDGLLCNILKHEFHALGVVLNDEQNKEANENMNSVRINGARIPINALTDNLEVPKVKPKECSEDHYIVDFETFRYMPGFVVDEDGDIRQHGTGNWYATEMKYLGGTKLTPEQIEGILEKGKVKVPCADGEGTWAIYRWMTTLAEYKPLKVKTWKEVESDPDMIITDKSYGKDAQHYDRRTGNILYLESTKWVGNQELTKEEYQTLLRKGKVVIHSGLGKSSTIVPWKLKFA